MPFTRNCKQCNLEFLARRTSRQFCSKSCRMKYTREVSRDSFLAPEICKKGHNARYLKNGIRRCRECEREWARSKYNANKVAHNLYSQTANRHLRMEVLLAYGPWCRCCGESRYEFLSLEHVNGDGADHRREIGQGYAIYRWARKNDYPETLTVLCMNCNFSRGQYGYCPHEDGG